MNKNLEKLQPMAEAKSWNNDPRYLSYKVEFDNLINALSEEHIFLGPEGQFAVLNWMDEEVKRHKQLIVDDCCTSCSEMDEENKITCPECNGEKIIRVAFPHTPNNCTAPCTRCNETGKVLEEMLEWIENGKILKNKRRAKRVTFRSAAKILSDGDLDFVIKLSNMERGVVKPDMSIYDNLESNVQ